MYYSEEEAVQVGEPVASKKQEKLNNKKAIKSVQNESDDDEDEGNFPFHSLLFFVLRVIPDEYSTWNNLQQKYSTFSDDDDDSDDLFAELDEEAEDEEGNFVLESTFSKTS